MNTEHFHAIRNWAEEFDIPPASIPSSPTALEALTELDLYVPIDNENNKITYIPPAIGFLSKLKKINISYHAITKLPVEIANLINLEELLVTNCELKEIPEEINRLTKLTRISFEGNDIHNFDVLCSLVNLTSLDLSNNYISSIPKNIALLNRLQYLRIGTNRISFIPKELFYLTELIELDLSDNQLIELPDDVIQLDKLEVLNIGNSQLSDGEIYRPKFVKNKIQSLPHLCKMKSLKELYIHNNMVKSIPGCLINAAKLQAVMVDGNPLDIQSKLLINKINGE